MAAMSGSAMLLELFGLRQPAKFRPDKHQPIGTMRQTLSKLAVPNWNDYQWPDKGRPYPPAQLTPQKFLVQLR